jgi:hypothetical protein
MCDGYEGENGKGGTGCLEMRRVAQGVNEVYAVMYGTKVTANMSYLCLSKVVHETEETDE